MQDDIFIIYIGGEAKLNDFQTNINIMNDSINFDHEQSIHSIAFFDTLIYIDKNRQLANNIIHKTH